jgi:hypothetical protein
MRCCPHERSPGRETFAHAQSTKTRGLRAFPNYNGNVAAEKHIQQVLRFVRYLEAETFTDDDVPRGSELLVHCVLDHLSGGLSIKTKTKRNKTMTEQTDVILAYFKITYAERQIKLMNV